MSGLPECLSGFTVIPVAYQNSSHFIYARAHATSKSKPPKPSNVLPAERTLFLVNVPPDATEHELALLFKHCGAVERVQFDFNSADALAEHAADSDEEMAEDAEIPDTEARPRKKRKLQTSEPTPPEVIPLPSPSLRTLHKTGSCAHLIFRDSSSIAKAISAPTSSTRWPSSDEPRGLSHYMAKYDAERPPLETVKAHADSFMERFEFDLLKNKQDSKYRKGEAVVDEDGFTLVIRGGAYGQTLGGGVSVASKKFMLTGQTGGRRKKEKKEKEAFYSFQKAEKQRKAMLDLKKNFEADKERVEKLKESRRFKPY
ncbi:ribosomal RNA-processing protein 7-domain-containing protein [Suillus clintonianus]|uniref:ribosomal RNA-processing protein 7-domain-containing protein n=1 Tax=Suillus clintonianus TaxID=1904413 RepID=UPI001B86287D|nr:ribosomal RNA-processing protein 7-domain-containing protein [Suillus clintonianus]KAG2112402.1 ribosomal RNA-processing protein 7-domain-containing protein [Suillus clintonianus]